MEGTINVEKEMEVTGAMTGALDSKTYDYDTASTNWAAAKTTNAAMDMSMVTQTNTQGFENVPGTQHFGTNMSGIEEESEYLSAKTTNMEMSMDVDSEKDDDEDEDENEKDELAEEPPMKTVNFATDMDLMTGQMATVQHHTGAKTMNMDAPMEMDMEEDEDMDQDEEDEDVNQDALNHGFTKDWAVANGGGAKTVNFAAPMTMDLVEEEDEEEGEEDDQEGGGEEEEEAKTVAQKATETIQNDQMDESEPEDESDENDDNVPMQWALNAHRAAADAVRKSLEAGELMGRSSLGRKSMDRLSLQMERPSFGRASLTPSRPDIRESLNRSSILSPVEETAELEEEDADKQKLKFASPLPPPPMQEAAPQKTRPASMVVGHEMVEHPIAGIPVAAPQSRLPGLFDRRYSTRRIIKNFGHPTEPDAQYEEVEEQRKPKSKKKKVVAKKRTAEESFHMELNDEIRRTSMRQSIAPGELPFSDFLFLANIRFNDEQALVEVPELEGPVSNSLSALEIASLQKELAALEQEAKELQDAMEEEEMQLDKATNPLFVGVQGSDQSVLESLQADLGALKSYCVLQAETDSVAQMTSNGIAQEFRHVGEKAVQDTKMIYQLMGQMHIEREELRTTKMSTLEEICSLREDQKMVKKNQTRSANNARLMASAIESITHCTILKASEELTQMTVCDTVEVSVTPTTVSVSLCKGINAWRSNLATNANILTHGQVPRDAEQELKAIVQPIRAALLRAHAGSAELHRLARRFTIIYTEEAADVYFSSKTATAILHIPCGAISAYPSKSVKDSAAQVSLTVLKSQGDPTRLVAFVRDRPTGVGCFEALCKGVEKEFGKL
jgi:hypothetical protein